MDAALVKAAVAGTAALALLVGGGTLAALSDLAVVPGNRVGVGTLELTLAGAGGQPAGLALDAPAMVPGGPAATWATVVTVSGDVPASALYASVTGYAGSEDGCVGNTDPTVVATTREIDLDPACATPGTGGQLADVAEVRVSAYRLGAGEDCDPDVAGSSRYDSSAAGAAYAVGTPGGSGQQRTWGYRPLAQVTDGAAQQLRAFDPAAQAFVPVDLAPGDRLCVAAALRVPASADNRAAGDTAAFDVQLELVQR